MNMRNRVLSLLLTAAMLAGMFPAFTAGVKADGGDVGQYQEVSFGTGTIGNGDCKTSPDNSDADNGYASTNIAKLPSIWYAEGGLPGFSYTTTRRSRAPVLTGNQFRVFLQGSSVTLTINVKENPVLEALAQSDTAEVYVGLTAVSSYDKRHASKAHTDRDGGRAKVTIMSGDTTVKTASADSGTGSRTARGANTGWVKMKDVTTITIKFWAYANHGCGYGGLGSKTNNDSNRWARGELNLQFRDKTCPTLSSYTSDNSATVNPNDGGQLLMKLGTTNTPNDPENRYYDYMAYGAAESNDTNNAAKKSREWIDLTFLFSKPVGLSSPNNKGELSAVSPEIAESLSSHDLFTNTLGTGYYAQGVNRGLELYQAQTAGDEIKGGREDGMPLGFGVDDLKNYLKSISYLYTATYGDFNGNNPISNGGYIESGDANHKSLLQKIVDADFHDAAGNPLIGVTGDKGVNIFDKNDASGTKRGYDVIVDAVPPTYSRVGNGVAPDILTQLVLNGNDTVDFIVSFSEATITRRVGPDGTALWDNSKTYLMLNNGDKAYFKSKSEDGKQWTFTYAFKKDAAEEASLLKVIALGNDALDSELQKDGDAPKTGKQERGNDAAYTYNVDGRTITDYVGNVMVERANENSKTNEKQIESSIGWAGLAIDNTAPEIEFSYSAYGTGALTTGTDNDWGQAAKVLASAADPSLPVAPYDPDYAQDNTTRPSKGIYRPDNTTGSTASAVGLIFYVWTRSVTPPSTGDHFAAIKRYSLTGEQPRTVTGAGYHSAWVWPGESVKDYSSYVGSLMMANNFSDIVPPDAAMTSDGAWYLHVWTADMSWDSARALMQYDKAKTLQYKDNFDNAVFQALKQNEIETYRRGNSPSYAAAWNATKETFYDTVYSAGFLGWLAEGDASDRYSDAAMTYAMDKAEAAADAGGVYNSGYSAESLSDDAGSYKSQQIEAHLDAQAGTSKAAAWAKVKKDVYGAAFEEGFAEWLSEGNNDTLTHESGATDIEELAEQYASARGIYAVSGTTKVNVEVPGENEETVIETKDVSIYYDAASAETYRNTQISAYIDDSGNEIDTGERDGQNNPIMRAPTEEEAWDAVRADVYLAIYNPDFLCLLTGIDRTDPKYTPQVTESVSENMTPEQIAEEEKAIADEEARVEGELRSDIKAKLTGSGADAYFTDNAMSAAIDGLKATVYGEKVNEDTNTSTAYTAATAAALISTAVEDYIKENEMTEADAWEEIKADVYAAVYTGEFLARLDASGYDRYSEDAVNAVTRRAVEGVIYKDGYTGATAQTKKQELIDGYVAAHTTGQPKDPTPGYDESWNAVKEDVYESAYTEQFLAWLDASGYDRYSDAAMDYARTQAMLTLTQYDNTDVWPLGDFDRDDSNWRVETTRVLLDNTKPANATYDKSNMTGDGTAVVELPFTVSDALSGIDTEKVYYQWVLKKSDGTQTYNDVEWLQATPDSEADMTAALSGATYGKASATYTARTLGNAAADGEYILYLKYTDKAGNTAITNSDSLSVTVNTANSLICAFGPADALTGYRNAVTPVVVVKGVSVSKVQYAVTGTPDRPDNNGFADAVASGTDAENKTYTYTLPDLLSGTDRADGTWYVHALVYENVGQTVEPHYYRQAYRVDRTKPEISISPDGFGQQQDTVDVALTFSDNLSGVAAMLYRLSDSADEIDGNASGWMPVPADGKVTLSAGAEGEYYLHVRSTDQAGNTAVRVSAAYVLRGTKDISLLPDYSCRLLTTYQQDGVTYGVASLTLAAEDKAGYRYSVSTDSGATWRDWLPYMSMIRMKLPTGYTGGTLRVRFRAPDGAVGDAKNINTRTAANAIWATAEFDSLLKRNSSKKLTLLMNLPEGVTATEKTADGESERTVKLDNGDFTVSANGVYEFELKRGTQTASAPFTVVVDIFDDTPPAGYIAYSTTAPTSGTVVATVKANEPIYVKNIAVGGRKLTGRMQYSFSENGTAIFTIADEAGNTAEVAAAVSNIDRTAPNVSINTDYTFYKTVGTGDSLIASGSTLRASSDESFIVVNNDRVTTMEATDKGTYTFIVQDAVGNVAQVSREITNIVKTLPPYTVTYTHDDEGSTTVTEGEWKQGGVIATVTFDDPGDGRKLHIGATAANNELAKNNDGDYVYSRAYTANGTSVLVFCDDLGNVERVPVVITGIDNTAPTLTLNRPVVTISNEQTKRLPEMTEEEIKALLGGYTVKDNAYGDGFTVTVARSDDASKKDAEKGRLDESGKFTLVYTVTDPAGNSSRAEQTLIVIPADGLLVEAGDANGENYALLSGSSVNTTILPGNHVRFRIDKARMQAMFYGSGDGRQKVHNSEMEYDIFYVSGLYREGQLKTIATRISKSSVSETELTGLTFDVTFPKAGWYTIIIRNQERTREYTTFFVASAQ